MKITPEEDRLFPAHWTSVCIKEREEVTEENLGDVLGIVPFEQHLYIDRGDTVSIFYFHGGSLSNSGTLTIWHNDGRAAIKTPETVLRGEWIEELRLIVTDIEEFSWTLKGELVTGRIAMDLRGTQGLYSCGQFFPNTSDLMAVGF